MKFSDNGYYIEQYVKCDNCGVLIYDDGIEADVDERTQRYCSNWCVEWARARADGIEDPRIPLERELPRRAD